MDTADHKPASPPVPMPPPPLVADPLPSIPISTHETSCSSSDSDTDSDDDFFQIDANEIAHFPPIPIHEDPLIDLRAERIDDSHRAMDGSEKRLSAKYLGALSKSRQSPEVQLMARNDAVDLDRIPSSIFARSSPTPMEWSVASNESLFSIHMGSTSFTKDPGFLFGRSGDLSGFTSGFMESQLLPLPPPMNPVTARENMKAAIVDLGKMEEAAASANAEAMKDVMRAAAEQKEREREKPPAEALGRSISRHSDESTTSFRSFAFPVLTGDGRIGSTKADFMHHREHHPLSQVTSRKTTVAAQATAATAAPSSSRAPAPASVESSWFSSFSCGRFCC